MILSRSVALILQKCQQRHISSCEDIPYVIAKDINIEKYFNELCINFFPCRTYILPFTFVTILIFCF
jgi:hypothetical protein